MQQRQHNIPMLILTQAIAYFLAGSFLIKTVIPLQSPDGILQPLNCFSFAIGLILIFTGFGFVLTIPQITRLAGFVKRFHQWSFWLFPVVLAITITAILQVLFDFLEIKPLLITTIVFLTIVLALFVFQSRRVFQNERQLLSLVITFTIFAGILLFIGAQKIQVLFLLFLILACSFRLYRLISKRDGSQ